MQTVESRNSVASGAGAWRDLARLGVEALAVGVVFSVLLALAVFIVAHNGHGGEFADASVTTVAQAPQ